MNERKSMTPPASRKEMDQPTVARRASELAPSSSYNNCLRPLSPPAVSLEESPPSSPLSTPPHSLADLNEGPPQVASDTDLKDSILTQKSIDDEGNESIVLYVPEQTQDN